jgi:hypothetical protein
VQLGRGLARVRGGRILCDFVRHFKDTLAADEFPCASVRPLTDAMTTVSSGKWW